MPHSPSELKDSLHTNKPPSFLPPIKVSRDYRKSHTFLSIMATSQNKCPPILTFKSLSQSYPPYHNVIKKE